MTTFVVGNSGATFSDRLARVLPPFLSDCKGYHLFGGSQVLSVANLVDAAKPLTVIGTPTYPAANYARISVADGFATTDSFASQSLTAVLVCTDPLSADGTAAAPTTIMLMSVNGSLFAHYMGSTADCVFRTNGGSAGVSSDLGNNAIATVNPDDAPGKQYFYNRFELRAICDDGSQARLTIQEGSALKQFTGTTGVEQTAALQFGGTGFGTGYSKIAAAIYYGRAMDFDEVSEVWNFVMDDLDARGIAR